MRYNSPTAKYNIGGTGKYNWSERNAVTSIEFTTQANLTFITYLSGSTFFSFAESANLSGNATLTSTVPLLFGQRGLLTAQARLSGTSPIALTPTGKMIGSASIQGNTSIVFSQSGKMLGNFRMSGLSRLRIIPTGRLRGIGRLKFLPINFQFSTFGELDFSPFDNNTSPPGSIYDQGLPVYDTIYDLGNQNPHDWIYEEGSLD